MIFEFKHNGQFVREITLKEDATETSAEEAASVAGLSYLLPDPDGGFYLVRAAWRPRILKVGPAGEVLAERTLPEIKDTYVVGAVVGSGRLVLDRASIRTIGKPAPERRSRVIAILDAITLETVMEADWDHPGVTLFGSKDGEFLFLGRRAPAEVEIMKASLR